MLDQNFFTSVREPLNSAQSIFIFLPANPNLDKTAASLALFLSFKKAGKQVTIVCPTEMTVEFSDLFGVDQIRKKPQGDNLVVSFDYLEDSIEKVSYHIEEKKFNLVIQPKVGFPPLSAESIEYSYSGGKADLIFVIGARSLGDLGDLGASLSREKVVNLNNRSRSQLGGINLVEPRASSCSEIVAHFLSLLSLPIDVDIATNLLRGIERATRRFSSPNVGAATFEAAAYCLRAGAKRATFSGWRDRRKKGPLKPMPAQVSAIKKPIEPTPVKEKKPSPDWFEPKIYKSNRRI